MRKKISFTQDLVLELERRAEKAEARVKELEVSERNKLDARLRMARRVRELEAKLKEASKQ
jgi:hypothetical protein